MSELNSIYLELNNDQPAGGQLVLKWPFISVLCKRYTYKSHHSPSDKCHKSMLTFNDLLTQCFQVVHFCKSRISYQYSDLRRNYRLKFFSASYAVGNKTAIITVIKLNVK